MQGCNMIENTESAIIEIEDLSLYVTEFGVLEKCFRDLHAGEHFLIRPGKNGLIKIPNKGDWKLTMGRASNNDLVIKHSSISRYHVEIGIYQGNPYIRDLNSLNGTYVHGKRIPVDTTPLSPGTLFQLGTDTPDEGRIFHDLSTLCVYLSNQARNSVSRTVL